MTIDELVDSGAIRFFDGTDANTNEIMGDREDKTAIINALKTLYPSGTFQTALLSKLSPEESLWIRIDPGSDIAQGGLLIDPSLNRLGLVVISVFQNGGYINSTGSVESFSLERVLAHEMGHAILGLNDTIEDLTGGKVNPDYQGDTVKLIENVIAGEVGLGSDRMSYSGSDSFEVIGAPIDGVEIPTQWTGGEEIDVVLINKDNYYYDDGTLNVSQPGQDIDTASNTTKLRDLVIAVDKYGLDNIIRTGKGNDFIYAAGGNDDVYGGSENDTIRGGNGADWLLDRGVDEPIRVGETQEEYQQRLFAYDSDGNDTLEGGGGADVLVYSGGTDTTDRFV